MLPLGPSAPRSPLAPGLPGKPGGPDLPAVPWGGHERHSVGCREMLISSAAGTEYGDHSRLVAMHCPNMCKHDYAGPFFYRVGYLFLIVLAM